MLGAIGGENQQLGERIYFLLDIQQRRAQSLTQRRPAWFAGRHHRDAAQTQLASQQAKLGRLSATVYSFEGDKSAGHVLAGGGAGRIHEAAGSSFGSAGLSVAGGCCPRNSPVARRACEIVEMACLKISCSWAPDSRIKENLSKLLMRPNSFAPLTR